MVTQTLLGLCLNNLQYDEGKCRQNILSTYLCNHEVSQQDLEEHIEKCLAIEPISFAEHLQVMQKLFCIAMILSQKNTPQLKEKVLFKIRTTAYLETVWIIQAYRAIVQQLLSGSTELSNKLSLESIIDARAHFNELQKPDLLISTQLTGLGMVLAHRTNNADLKEQAVQLAKWHLNFIDAQGQPLSSLWCAHNDYEPMQVLCSFYFMLYAAQKIAHLQCQQLIDKLLSHIQSMAEHELHFIASYLLFLCELVNLESCEQPETLEEIHSKKGSFIDSTHALQIITTPYIHAAFSLTGIHTGIGTLHCKDIKIVAIAPQVLPLNSFEQYGIYNPARSHSIPSHIRLDQNCLAGWTALSSINQDKATEAFYYPSSIWMYTKITHLEDKIQMQFSFAHQKLEKKLAIAFYVQAKTCHIDKKEYLSDSLAKYQDQPKEIILRGKQASLSLHSCDASLLHVIALGDSKKILHSHFLIAFEPNLDHNECHITLKKD